MKWDSDIIQIHASDHNDRYSRSLRRQKRPPLYSSPSDASSDDWDSEFTVLDDAWRRHREKGDRRQNPRTEDGRGQLTQICERIWKVFGQDIQYAVTYKGVKDIVTVIKYSGQNDSGMFTMWLDHLLMYFQLNRMCGPDNEVA